MTATPRPPHTISLRERADGGPRPHVLQVRALARLGEDLADGGRGVVVMPCGAGKTLLGRWFAEQVAARLVVVCVPTLALVPQTLLAYRSQTSWPHAAMIVCSDPASGRAVGLADLELPDWARAAVTASTSTRRIGEFLTGPTPGARLIVSTYHSAPRVAAALRATGRTADLLVCDEAHRLTGQPRREFRAVLDDDALAARRRMFLTATPVEAAAWAADVDDEDVTAPLSLDDEELFGPTIYRATFADAVAAGRLVDYDVEVLAVRPAAGDDPDRDAGAPGAAHAVLSAVRDGATRVLTFHSRVRSARELAAHIDGHRLADGRTVRAEHLEARHGAHQRAAALERLADPAPGTVSVLASARILTEGVDVPAVDTVVFAEPRTSPVDVVHGPGPTRNPHGDPHAHPAGAADAVLPGRWASVPAWPTWALLGDMIARGWPKAWIAREIGHRDQALQLHRDRVSAANADAVVQLDRRLGRRHPPPRRCRTPLPTLAELLTAETAGDRGQAS